MNPREPTNGVVARLVAAINDGDRAAFLSLLAPDAELTDDGTTKAMLRVVYFSATSAYSRGSLATQSLGTTTV